MDDTSKNLDLSKLSYEEWIKFFFDRPVIDDSNERYDLFRKDHDSFDASKPSTIINYLETLCRNFVTITERYSLQQIDQGIWAIFGPEIESHRYLTDRSVPLEKRLNCIRSMYFVYADFVAKSDIEVMENCFDMWWDFLSTNFWAQVNLNMLTAKHQGDSEAMLKEMGWKDGMSIDDIIKNVKKKEPDDYESKLKTLNNDEKQILDVMLEILCKILQLDDGRCQQYALHGLGHLHHPKVKQVVQDFINKHEQEIDPNRLEWLEQCRDGTVM